MRMSSGSWRSTYLSAVAYESVSRPISRWLMMDLRSLCSTSMGSSTVTTWRRIVLLMWSIIAASVVVLPEPVVPVTSTSPRGSRASRLMISGR